MTLAYENGASTIDRAYGLSEAPAAAWTIPVSAAGPGKTRSAPLAALAGTSISSRFCSWIGFSGQRYVFSIYAASECPAFRDAVLLAVIRDMTGQRRVILVRDTGAFPERMVADAQCELRAFGLGLEFHLHLLAASSAEREATIADLAITGD
jgi:hypothetical protein